MNDGKTHGTISQIKRKKYATVPDGSIQQYRCALGAPVGKYDICECCCCHFSSDKLNECTQSRFASTWRTKVFFLFCLLESTTHCRTVNSFILNRTKRKQNVNVILSHTVCTYMSTCYTMYENVTCISANYYSRHIIDGLKLGRFCKTTKK